MNQNSREHWGSRIGFIMAAAGSAVGLGNIWRFPYVAGDNGGGAFMIIYLVCVFFIVSNIMVAELAVGRRSQLGAVGAYKSISKKWTFAGALGVLSGFLIMGFYPVVGGWALAHVFKSFTGLLNNPAMIGANFDIFIESPVQPLIWMTLFLFANVWIVAKGVKGGIETAGKFLMPLLFVLLLIIAGRSLTLSGAGEGIRFLFQPDWSEVNAGTVLAALGQAFFSLSLGMGCMITYGSYLDKKENLPNNAILVLLMDTGVAILAGLALFPAIFAFGMTPSGGPGLVFVVAPTIFAEMGFLGIILSTLFFGALMIAALTSSVSLLEVVVTYLIDEKALSRKKAVGLAATVMVVLCIFSSLSLGMMQNFSILGVGMFDFFDILTDKIFLAIGGLLLAIFTGWTLKKEDLRDELTNGGQVSFKLFDVWYLMTKFVVPVVIGLVAIAGIMSIEETGVMILGLLIIFVFALFSKKL